MPYVAIYSKGKGRWLTARQINDLLASALLSNEFEWEVSMD